MTERESAYSTININIDLSADYVMNPKSDSVANRSENTLTSTPSDSVDVPNESVISSTPKTDGMPSNTAPESTSNDQTETASTTEFKTDDDNKGMHSLCPFIITLYQHLLIVSKS